MTDQIRPLPTPPDPAWNAVLDDLTLDQFHALIYDLWRWKWSVSIPSIRNWRKIQGLPTD